MKIITKNVWFEKGQGGADLQLCTLTKVNFHTYSQIHISEHKRIKHSRFTIQVSFLGCEIFRQIQWKFTPLALYFYFLDFVHLIGHLITLMASLAIV